MVRRIFAAAARGDGLKTIARELTRDGIEGPKYTPRDGLPKLGAWSPGTVRSILRRSLYRGVVEWNRKKKRDEWGRVRVSKRPETDLVSHKAPELRIVNEKLWKAANAKRLPLAPGRPPKKREVSLLAGFARCGLCGGGIVKEKSGGVNLYYYGCGRRRHTGACENATRIRVEALDEAILHAVEDHLTPKAVARFLAAATAEIDEDRDAKLLAEVEQRIARVVEAIETGDGAVAPLAKRVATLEAEREKLAARIASPPKPKPRIIKSKLAAFRAALRASTRDARGVLSSILTSPIVLEPDGRFEAAATFEPFAGGGVVGMPELPSYIPRGDRRGLAPTELEAQYDATEKGKRPWRDSNPRSPP